MVKGKKKNGKIKIEIMREGEERESAEQGSFHSYSTTGIVS